MTDKTVIPVPTTSDLIRVLRLFADPNPNKPLPHDCGCRFCRATRLVRAWDQHNAPAEIAVERVR